MEGRDFAGFGRAPANRITALIRGGVPGAVTIVPEDGGEQVKVRIIRANGSFVEGDEPTVAADYGKALIENGLAEPVEGAQKSRKRERSAS